MIPCVAPFREVPYVDDREPPPYNRDKLRYPGIPKDLPRRSTVNDYFCLWSDTGTLETIHHALYLQCREQAEREASPTSCIVDSQSVKSAEKGGTRFDPHGFDGGKSTKGKKRHVLVDTLGRLHARVTLADVQDRDGGLMVLSTLFGQFPFLKKLFADNAYAGPVFRDDLANAMPNLATEIIRRCDQVKGFVVLPKHWIVERTIGCLGRCRRLAKDWENLNRSALAFLRLASIRGMLKKLCNPS